MSAPLRRGVWGVVLAALLGAGVLMLALSCGSSTGTALFVQVDFPGALQPTQLRFSVDDGGSALLGTKVLPAEAGNAALTSGQTVRFLLPDAAGGKTVAVEVEGLVQGAVMARGRGEVKAVVGEEVKVTVTLAAVAAACDAQSCPQGCCRDGVCVSPLTETACGTGGQACAVCDPTAADGCVDGACSCGSGPACAAGEMCQGGQCVCQGSGCSCVNGACTTPGPCESGPGVCSSGTCSYMPKVEGDACDDGRACTEGDVCSASGTCAGTAKVCDFPPDSCYEATGSCDPASGQCSNAPKATGTTCDDGDACTSGEKCDGSGSCGGGTATVCNSPPDDCHQATGTCGTDGVCVYALKSAGAACDDGDRCTTGDACDAGGTCAGTPKTCAASDQCHKAGTCDPGTGVCSDPAKANGSSCSDGDACTQTDTCQSGVCQGGTPKLCPVQDACHDAVCDSSTGACSSPAKPNGTSCSDGNACSIGDSCQSGVCQSGAWKLCPGQDACHTAACNTSTGVCSTSAKPNGTTCDDGNACTLTDTCQSGTCTGGAQKACNSTNPCVYSPGTCNISTGACSFTPKSSGSFCSDGDVCTEGDSCDGSGACRSGAGCTGTEHCCPAPQGCVPNGTYCQ